MKWNIPAKTFLLGEYAAIAESSAIILTTTPYFEISLSSDDALNGIHPDSPAGVWWQQQNIPDYSLTCSDPYNNLGGLGASSAQFLGSYFASCHLQKQKPDLNSMLNAYYQVAWSGKGLRPSGYDVIAQSRHGCVYINKQKKAIQSYSWPFKDLSFLLLHTGVKLATHHHLQATALPDAIDQLTAIVEQAKQAFDTANSKQLINAINDYHKQLNTLNLVASHSLEYINKLKNYSEVLAIKGCGALGSDVLLILTTRKDSPTLKQKLISEKWSILATENNLT